MIVSNFHQIASFKQSKWLETYISFNAQKRTQAANDFEKKLLKIFH